MCFVFWVCVCVWWRVVRNGANIVGGAQRVQAGRRVGRKSRGGAGGQGGAKSCGVEGDAVDTDELWRRGRRD